MNRIWCDNCKAVQPLIRDDLNTKDISGKYQGQDLICGHCKLVITTIFKESIPDFPKGHTQG